MTRLDGGAVPTGEDIGCVLLVDDNASIRTMLAMSLRKSGYRYQEVASGEEAVAVVARTHVGLILMDLQLPGIDGKETTRRIRSTDRRVPIVGMTAAGHGEKRRSCLAAGMDDVFDKVSLLSVLPKLLSRFFRQPANEAVAPPAPVAGDVVLDYGDLAARRDLTGLEMLTATFAEFTAFGEQTLAAINSALGDGRRDVAASLAHKLAGGAAVFRLVSVHALLNDLERLLRSPVIDEGAVAILMERLAPIWQQSVSALRSWLDGQRR